MRNFNFFLRQILCLLSLLLLPSNLLAQYYSNFALNKGQEIEFRKKISTDENIIYKDAYYELVSKHYFKHFAALYGGFDTTKLCLSEYNRIQDITIYRIKDYYLGILFHERCTKLILLSNEMKALDSAGTYESWHEPHYKLKDVNNDGISEFVFYEFDGCGGGGCPRRGIKALIYGVDTIHNKLSLMLSFSKSASIYETGSYDKLLREEKSVLYFTNQNKLSIKYFYREKTKKWLFLRKEKYFLDTKKNVYYKLN